MSCFGGWLDSRRLAKYSIHSNRSPRNICSQTRSRSSLGSRVRWFVDSYSCMHKHRLSRQRYCHTRANLLGVKRSDTGTQTLCSSSIYQSWLFASYIVLWCALSPLEDRSQTLLSTTWRLEPCKAWPGRIFRQVIRDKLRKRLFFERNLRCLNFLSFVFLPLSIDSLAEVKFHLKDIGHSNWLLQAAEMMKKDLESHLHS